MDPTTIAQAIPSEASSWGYIAGGLVIALMSVEKYLQNRNGDNKVVKAVTEDNARLENRAREADQRVIAADARADKAEDERDAMLREFGEVKSQYERLSERLDWLSKQNDELRLQNNTLIQQNNELTALLRGKTQ